MMSTYSKTSSEGTYKNWKEKLRMYLTKTSLDLEKETELQM
jgi:hypothetical protein